MKTFSSLEEALNFAITSARECAEFYTRFANKARNSAVKKLFEQFARDEYNQMANLTRIIQDYPQEVHSDIRTTLTAEQIQKAKCPQTEMNYSEALVLAMRKATVAFNLNIDLLALVANEDIKAVLRQLAQKEANHRHSIEIEYNESLLVCC